MRDFTVVSKNASVSFEVHNGYCAIQGGKSQLQPLSFSLLPATILKTAPNSVKMNLHSARKKEN
jgi:hypothetical protein